MNRPRLASRIAALIWAAAASLMMAVSAWADPPARVARLGWMSGGVSFSPAGEDDWVQAAVNRPLVTGDRLWVVPGGRAELQFGASSVRIGSGTAVNLLNLDDRVAQLELTQGTVHVRVRRFVPGQVLEIDTPNLAFSLRRTGTYRITVDPAADSTTVVVREGQGDVFGDGAAGYVINQGNAYTYYGSGLRDFDRLDRIGVDEFERWSLERERRYARSTSARYVSQDVIGYEDLDTYGAWRNVSGYGSVWFPQRVAADWAPYRDGHWSWIEPWGWTWIDEQPWGFAVSHYGRWAHMNGGWGWVPGPVRERAVYAPALVAFIGGAGASLSISAGPAIGWFPLGPREVYRPSYPVSREYFARVNNSNTVINNVTNFYNTNVNVTYVNQRVPNAVIAVPQQAFIQSQPVSRAAVRMNLQQVTNQPVAPMAAIAPVERSLRGATAAATRPPAAAIQRAVVARTQPPPPAPTFQARQQALQASPGKPLTTADVERLRPRAPAADQTPAPRVITAPAAAPTTPMANVQPQRPAPGVARGRPDGAPQAGVETGRPQPGQPTPPVAQPSAQPPGQATERPGLGRGRPDSPATAQPAPPAAQPAPTPPQAQPAPQPGPERDRPGQGRGRPDSPATAQPAAPAAQPAPAPPQAQPAPQPGPERDRPGQGRGRPDSPATAQPAPPAAQPAPTPPQAQPAPQPGQGRGRPDAPVTAQPAPPAAQPAPTPAPPAPSPAAVERRQGPPEGRGPDARGPERGRPEPQAAPQPAPPPPAPVARPQPAPQPAPPPPPAPVARPQPAPPPPQASAPPPRPPEQRAAPQPQAPQAAPQPPRGPERAQPQQPQQPQGPAAERKGPPEQRGQGKSDERKADERKKDDDEKKAADEKKGRGQ